MPQVVTKAGLVVNQMSPGSQATGIVYAYTYIHFICSLELVGRFYLKCHHFTKVVYIYLFGPLQSAHCLPQIHRFAQSPHLLGNGNSSSFCNCIQEERFGRVLKIVVLLVLLDSIGKSINRTSELDGRNSMKYPTQATATFFARVTMTNCPRFFHENPC
jgi:hypothetical protein